MQVLYVTRSKRVSLPVAYVKKSRIVLFAHLNRNLRSGAESSKPVVFCLFKEEYESPFLCIFLDVLRRVFGCLQFLEIHAIL